MHSLHFGFGLGALISPQVAQPFLSPDSDFDDEDHVTTPYPSSTFSNTTVVPGVSRIEIPYCMMAILITAFAVVVFALYLKGPPKGFPVRTPTKNFKKMINPASCGKGNSTYGLALLVVLFFYYIQTVGGERAMSKYLFSYAVDGELRFTKREASNLQTAFWASFTAGRLSGVPISKFVSAKYMILGTSILSTVVAVVMATVAYNNVLGLWITSCLIGALVAVVFPNGMAWANTYLDVNSVGVMVAFVGGSCGDFAYNYATGFLFEKDPRNLMYVMVFYGAFTLVVFGVMQSLAHFLGKKYFGEDDAEEEEDVEKMVAEKVSDSEMSLQPEIYVERYRKLSM